jgi:flagellar hook-associated protein 2
MAGSISTLGVGSGLQLQDIIDKLRAVDQQVVDRKKTDITKYESQLEEFTTVKNKLLTLKGAALNLSLSGSFIGRTVSSSTESAMTATTSDGATVKSTVVNVTNLAQQSNWMSNSGFATKDDIVVADGSPDQTLVIQVGTKEISLSVAANTTLSQLTEQINAAADNPGVTASAVNDGLDQTKPYKLALTANNFGEDARITVLTQLPGVVMAEQPSQAAADSLNAKFSMDGISYQRQSNTVNNALFGVTLNFKGTGSSTITVANNDAGLKEMITTMVTAYNDVVKEVQDKSNYDSETKSFGILRGTTLPNLPFDLQGVMTATNTADPEGNIKSLFDLGLEFNRDGTVAINDTTLSQAISDYGAGVQAFFLGDTENNIEGLGDKINNRLRTLTSTTGILEGEKTAAQSRIDDLNLKITESTARLDKRYELLNQQFVALDTYMNKMTSMSNFLTGQFKSLSDGWASSSSSS